jgi:exosortase
MAKDRFVTKLFNSRDLLFICFSMIVLFAFSGPITTLFARSFHDEINDYIIIIPLVSVYFFYLQRQKFRAAQSYALPAGIGCITLGAIIFLIGMSQEGRLNQNDFLSIATLSFVITWIGGFVLFYGLTVFQTMRLPLLLLFFMVPLPTVAMDKTISFLQEGSAEVTYLLFQLVGMPVMREGFVFHLPHISIEVAKQCSGIYSAISLFIVSVIVAALYLSTGWKRVVLILSVIPLTILKNGMRIVTLSLLGNNIDERILSSPLHRKGGIPFFLLALCELLVVLWLLRRTEAPSERSNALSVSSKRSELNA